MHEASLASVVSAIRPLCRIALPFRSLFLFLRSTLLILSALPPSAFSSYPSVKSPFAPIITASTQQPFTLHTVRPRFVLPDYFSYRFFVTQNIDEAGILSACSCMSLIRIDCWIKEYGRWHRPCKTQAGRTGPYSLYPDFSKAGQAHAASGKDKDTTCCARHRFFVLGSRHGCGAFHRCRLFDAQAGKNSSDNKQISGGTTLDLRAVFL